MRKALLPARAQLNRLVVIVALVTILPLVAIAERFRPGRGRAVAIRAVRGLGWVCGVRFDSRGADHLDSCHPYVLVANHSSPVDIPAILLANSEARFLAAAELFRVPLLRQAMRALRTVPVERRDAATAHRQMDELAAREDPWCLTIFPEGGIAPPGERLAFKTGAFALAIKTAASVVPVAIHNSGKVLPPRARLAVRPGTVLVEFLAPIATHGLGIDDRHQLRDEARDAILGALASAAPSRPR